MNAPGQIEQDGYRIVPDIVPESAIDSLIEELGAAHLPRSRAGVRHVMNHPTVRRMAHDRTVLRLVQDILGHTAVPFRATLFDKSPTANWLVMWHQDTALPLLEKKELPGWGPWSVKGGVNYAHAPAEALEQILAVRLHLDDSNLSNGPLRVLPGTHQGGVLTDEQIHELSEQLPAVDCLVSKGGLLLMRPLIAHASSKSTSQEPRRVVHIEYAAKREILPGLTLAIA